MKHCTMLRKKIVRGSSTPILLLVAPKTIYEERWTRMLALNSAQSFKSAAIHSPTSLRESFISPPQRSRGGEEENSRDEVVFIAEKAHRSD